MKRQCVELTQNLFYPKKNSKKYPRKKISTSQISIPQTTHRKPISLKKVVSVNSLAPKGYHIPTDAEWTILTDNLGDKVGTKPSDLSDWDYYGTNSSRFAGLPGGFRNSFGHFNDIWANGTWWRLSDNFTNNAWCRNLYLGTNGHPIGGAARVIYCIPVI